MKVAISAIGKLENKYIREWVEYNKLIGIDKIFLYDNNDTWGEYFTDVIKDYIDSEFIKIIDYRGRKIVQCESYQETLNNYNKDYDYICFIDCDEFITFTKAKSIKEYLSDECFNNYDIIKLNFLAYGDNDLLENNSNSVLNVFKKPLDVNHLGPLNYPNNLHSKCIIKCKSYLDIKWCEELPSNGRNGDPHIPFVNENIKCCNNKGDEIKPLSICPLNYEKALIRHYSTKTIKEFVLNKFRRGFPDQICKYSFSDYVKNIGTFFSFNRATNEKLNLLGEITKDLYEENRNNIIVSEARGRIGNTLFTIATGLTYAMAYDKEYYLYLNHEMAQYIKTFKNGKQCYYTDWILSNEIFKNIKVITNLDKFNYSRIDCYEKNSNTYSEIPLVYGDLYIHGFRQSPKYFSRYRMRDIFKPSEEFIDKIKAYVNCNLKYYVSINIRRGDFLNPANNWIMYVTPMEWIEKVMNLYNKEQKFLIVTDDIKWAQNEFKNKDNCKVLDYNEDDKEFVDLFVQTLCKDNIISNSTFSWWAAYLNIHDNRKVYYHSPWYLNGQGDGDIIPENDNWIDIQ